MAAPAHQPVLLAEAVTALAIRPDGVYVDATYGRGGHAGAILARLGPTGRLLALDRDPEAVADAEVRYADDRRFTITKGPFSMLGGVVTKLGLSGAINGVLLDLGVSSPQLDDPRRGFSFRHEGPLDMRMDPHSGVSAADWLNAAEADEIAQVIHDYGEERYARRIARAVVRERGQRPIRTTHQLAGIVAGAVPTREAGKDPATRTFQAIRIFINRELEELQSVLVQALTVLTAGGRLVVISFHSLEDRVVKRFFQTEARGDSYPIDLPVRHDALRPRLRLVGKAIRPGDAELVRNPRARSAVLRVAERTQVRP